MDAIEPKYCFGDVFISSQAGVEPRFGGCTTINGDVYLFNSYNTPEIYVPSLLNFTSGVDVDLLEE